MSTEENQNTDETDQTIQDVQEFILESAEWPFKVRDPKTGTVDDFIVREMDGTERDQYLTETGARARPVKGGAIMVKDFNGMNADLLKRCVFKKDANGDFKSVHKNAIQSWPAKMQSIIFKKALELNDLNPKKEDDDGKND